MDDIISLPFVLAWIRTHLRKIVLGGIVCAILAAPVGYLKPKVYESTATLLVSPPTFKNTPKPTMSRDSNQQKPESISEMMPPTLPVETYKVLATSPSLLQEIILRVPLEDVGIHGLSRRLTVELVQMGSRSAQTGIMYTQAIIFHARANDPELAAKIAQVWAETFKEQMDKNAAKGIKDSFQLLETLHSSTKTQFEQADLTLAEHKKVWNLDLIAAQIEAKQKDYTQFEGTLKQTEVELAAGESGVKALQEELAKEPEKRVFFRAPSDDAYWIAGLEKEGKAKDLPEKGLQTEEANPNYTETRNLLVTAAEKLESLRAKRESIVLKLEELKKEMDSLTATLADQTVERNKLTRETESLAASYALVRSEYEKGRMASQTQASDIVLAGNAVVPDAETGTSTPIFVVVAGMLGMAAVGGILLLIDLSKLFPIGDLNGSKKA